MRYAKLSHVEPDSTKPKRRKTPWVIGTLMVASLAMLVILQSTNLWKTFTIESSSDLLLLYALSSLNFVAFIIFGFIFLRSIIKLVRERRTFELGAQIKTRLLIYFFALSLLPIIAMAVFSYLFMNRALERWFSQIPQNVIRGAQELQQSSIEDRVARLDGAARMLAETLAGKTPTEHDIARIAEAGRHPLRDGQRALAGDARGERRGELAHVRAVSPSKRGWRRARAISHAPATIIGSEYHCPALMPSRTPSGSRKNSHTARATP